MERPRTTYGSWPIPATALVGRDREIRRMIELLDRVSPGRPAMVVLDGPPGSGRSRLLEELAAVGRCRGATVRLDSAEPPRERLLFISDHPQRVPPQVWDELDRLAASAPVLVAIAARGGPWPALVVSAPEVRRLRLAPLATADVRRLAAGLLGARPGPRLLDLARVAAARPGTIRDLVAGLEEQDLIRVTDGVADAVATRLPERIRGQLGDRMAAMSPAARHLVQAATTLPSPFPLGRLSGLVRASLVTLLPAIDEVLDSGLLVATADGQLAFSHELVRPIVESSMHPAVVAALRNEHSRAKQRGTVTPRRDTNQAPGPRTVDWSLLSARELEIAEYVGQALTNRQIAHRVGRSPHTVNYHLRQVFRKLGLVSRVELVSLMRRREAADAPAARRSSS